MRELITKAETARRKGTTRQNVNAAVNAGKLTVTGKHGVTFVVCDRKFNDWNPKRRAE